MKKEGNQWAQPWPEIDYTERMKIVPCDDVWPEYEEQVFDFLKSSKTARGHLCSKEGCIGRKR